jgi:hypothetical protein
MYCLVGCNTVWSGTLVFGILCHFCYHCHIIIIIIIQLFGPVLAGTRAQSGDRYGSGTLHSGQILRDSLPLLFLAFRSSHFRRQMPPRPQQRERS